MHRSVLHCVRVPPPTRRGARLTAAFAALALWGCSLSSTPGTFHVTFVWPDGPPTFSQPVYVFAQVDDQSATPATILQLAGPVEYTGAAITLPFTTVPDGDNRVVVIQIQQTSSSDSQVYYYGKSSPFSLKAGVDINVPVDLMLQLAPGATPPGVDAGTAVSSAVTIVSPVTPGYVSCGPPPIPAQCPVKLILTTTTGVSVKLANELDGVDSATPQAITAAGGSGAVITGWDLNAGLSATTLAACDVKTAQQGCPRTVYAQFADANGFTSPVVSAQTTLDEVPPGFTSAGTAVPAVVGLGHVETFTVTANEPLLPTPKLTVTGPAQLVHSWLGTDTTYTFTATIPASDPTGALSGMYAEQIAMTDLAGNTATLAGPSFEVDSIQPAISGVTVSGGYASPAGEVFSECGIVAPIPSECDQTGTKSFNVVGLAFNLNKALPVTGTGALVAVTVGGTPLTCTAGSETASLYPYSCAYTIPETTPSVASAQSQEIVIQATDEAGNAGTPASQSVVFDFEPLTMAVTLTPNPSNSSSSPEVSVTTSKPLPTTPTLAVMPASASTRGQLAASGVTGGGTSWQSRLTVSTTPLAGSFTVTASGRDDVGHTQAAAGTLTINNTAPTVGGLQLNASRFSARSGFNSVQLTFDYQDDLDGTQATSCIAVIGGFHPGGAPLTMTCSYESGAADYSCTYAVSGLELSTDGITAVSALTQAVLPVIVTATDSVGNQATASTSLIFDFAPPTVSFAAVNYTPGAGNPLAVTAAATYGTTVTVQVTANETIDATAPFSLVAADGAGNQLSFTPIGTPGSSGGAFQAVVPSTWPRVAATLLAPTVTWTDVVGNETSTASFAAPAVTLQTAAVSATGGPLAAPNTAAGGPIAYGRVPWGSAASGGKAQFTISAGAGAAPGAAALVVYDSPDPASASLLGLATVDGSGAIAGSSGTELKLQRSDHSVVYLAAADSAGNLSPAAASHSTSWTASFGGKVSGSTTANPNVVLADVNDSVFRLGSDFNSPLYPARSGTSATEIADYSGLFPAATSALTTTASSLAWTTPGSVVPPTRSNPAMAYDSARGVTVVFGGTSGSYAQVFLNDTWELSGSTWTQVFPATSPPTGNGYALVYDSARGVSVMAGGGFAATWEWNGANWTQLAPPTSLAPRTGPAMAYDSARGVTVVFGGTATSGNTGSELNDTWEWNGANWTQIFPQTVPPTGYESPAMVFDSARGVSVLLAEGDTWEWNGVNWQAEPSGPAIYYQGMAYDPSRAATVVFGGYGGDFGAYANETWEWNGAAWTPLSPVTSPPGRSYPGLAYDTSRGALVMFGGELGTATNGTALYADDTWVWNGATWAELLPVAAPPVRSNHALAYDSSRGVTVLFGGYGTATLGDTWEWNGSGWAQQAPQTSPSARLYHSMAYDSARGVTVLFGGAAQQESSDLDDTWVWDGATWTQLSPATTPGARDSFAMAYDSSRGVTVLFGGFSFATSSIFGDTWEWDGTNWTQLSPPTNPPSSYASAMAYDSGRGVMVMFGGLISPPNNDTWEFNGHDWTEVHSATSPPAGLYYGAMAYDSSRGVTVLFGGGYADPDVTQTGGWEWDGVNWSPLALPEGPGDRYEAALAYDSARGDTVLFGGWDRGTSSFNDTWILTSGFASLPANLVQFDFAVTGETFAAAPISELSVRAIAGGTGYAFPSPADGGFPLSGATLAAWNNSAGSGAFRTLGTNAANPDAGSPMSYTTSSAWEAGQYSLAGPWQTIDFALFPNQPTGNGPTPGQLSVRDVELTVQYQHSESACGDLPDGGCLCASDEVACGPAGGPVVCADLAIDPQNCGGCASADAGSVCANGQWCLQGTCGCPALPGDGGTETLCEGTCTDTKADRLNCGSCGTVCPLGSTCSGGVCAAPSGGCRNDGDCTATAATPVCNPTTGQCVQCANNADCTCQSDAGACSTTTPYCSAGGACVACLSDSMCPEGTCTHGACESCSAGELGCAGVCTAVLSDQADCGACGTVCPASTTCQSGLCTCDVSGESFCNGSCVNELDDLNNCGGCNNVCPALNGCQSGSCVACPVNDVLCGSSCINLDTDPDNCGACGTVCPGGESCLGGCVTNLVAFSTCGATGNLGPTQAQCNTVYGAGVVTITGSGVQNWTVPATGTYNILAHGAASGADGASIQGTFTLTAGTVLQIVVGQMASDTPYASGGGGGSFVVTSAGQILVIAGGGGGSPFAPGQAGTAGNPGGTNGAGGGGQAGSGGGGYSGAGTSDPNGFSTGGQSFLGGAAGGVGLTTNGEPGGFGGGGGAGTPGIGASGGGGGYSGGNGGPFRTASGGGGSYNSGTDQVNTTGGAPAGDGSVSIGKL